MGAIETADLLDQAADSLREAADCTGLEVEDINAYVVLQGVVTDLDADIKVVSTSWENEWDGDACLHGGERALSDAADALQQAAAGEGASGISEVEASVSSATEYAEQARTLMGQFETARAALAEKLEAAKQETEDLLALAKQVVDAMWSCAEHGDVGSDRAREIAEKLRNAVA
jgi:hypothetical protein